MCRNASTGVYIRGPKHSRYILSRLEVTRDFRRLSLSTTVTFFSFFLPRALHRKRRANGDPFHGSRHDRPNAFLTGKRGSIWRPWVSFALLSYEGLYFSPGPRTKNAVIFLVTSWARVDQLPTCGFYLTPKGVCRVCVGGRCLSSNKRLEDFLPSNFPIRLRDPNISVAL